MTENCNKILVKYLMIIVYKVYNLQSHLLYKYLHVNIIAINNLSNSISMLFMLCGRPAPNSIPKNINITNIPTIIVATCSITHAIK